MNDCRVGEAGNPGPGVNNKQFGGVHILRDERAEWCRGKGLVIQIFRGDGNCLSTCLGESTNLDGHQINKILVERVNECWQKIMRHDLDGSGLAHFVQETEDRKEWGGAEQIA
eukprot:325402-Heterocapsa_arctica.AAC.1